MLLRDPEEIKLGDSMMELIHARNHYPRLRLRLDAGDTALTNAVNSITNTLNDFISQATIAIDQLNTELANHRTETDNKFVIVNRNIADLLQYVNDSFATHAQL